MLWDLQDNKNMKENNFPKYVANPQKWARAIEELKTEDEETILERYKLMGGLVLFDRSFRKEGIEEVKEPSSNDVIEAEQIIEETKVEEVIKDVKDEVIEEIKVVTKKVNAKKK